MSLDNNKNNGFDDDYLELLNSVHNDEPDSKEDYGFSVKKPDIESSGRSGSANKGIYISNAKRRHSDFEDIYSSSDEREIIISRKPKIESFEYEEINTFEPTRKAETATAERPAAQKRAQSRPMHPPASTLRANRVYEDESSEYDERRKPRKKKRVGGKIALAIVAIILVVCVFIGGSAVSLVSSTLNSINKADAIEHITAESDMRSDKDVKNILIIGKDVDDGGVSRSDTMIIASLNFTTGKVIMTSILRDVHIDIPEYGETKINAAFAYGGANLLVQTIEENFGIKIDGYALFDFKLFSTLINAVGGVNITLDDDEFEYMDYWCHYHFPDDTFELVANEECTLNGNQALTYARMRKIDSDFERTNRQRKVIESILSKLTGLVSVGGVIKLKSVAKEIAPLITTSFEKDELLDIATRFVKCFAANSFSFDGLLVSQHIPFGDDNWWYFDAWDGSSIGIDLEYNRDTLLASVYDDVDSPKSELHSDD